MNCCEKAAVDRIEIKKTIVKNFNMFRFLTVNGILYTMDVRCLINYGQDMSLLWLRFYPGNFKYKVYAVVNALQAKYIGTVKGDDLYRDLGYGKKRYFEQ
jgi:hypothetical protein